ncbi:hypothetical protein Nepgr_004892 [Nepenthes gracilis]|uniref:Uncharacterized protein n=1 Tax=Nepenthes gracilis TaxID=150966 RepID=A0AAD3S241_NEPGR|nr:hypothetical protein Nepgr_004892 [Nepenthes gracilis]
MPSAVLASQNESNWPPARAGCIADMPILNRNTDISDPLSHSRKKKSDVSARQITRKNADEFSCPTASDDASSFAQGEEDIDCPRIEHGLGFSNYISFDLSTFSRFELRSLRSRLMAELEEVRCLENRIESGEFQARNVLRNPPPTEKKLSGNKRSMPLPSSGNESKRVALSPVTVPASEGFGASIHLMKMCRQILNKLMKQKFCWIFNKPVDAVALGLSDYHRIVKHPMDLGTIKLKLSRNMYRSPDDFAADVRLTFNNALLYNPKGEHVHDCAEQYLGKFEQMFQPISQNLEIEKRQRQKSLHLQQEKQSQRQQWKQESKNQPHRVKEIKEPEHWREEKHKYPNRRDNEESVAIKALQACSRSRMPLPCRPKKASSTKKLEQVDLRSEPPTIEATTAVKVPVDRPASGKLPKPKVEDLNKREMSGEEKQKLGFELENLPDEKMAQVVQIIRKRNGHLNENGGEIELDMDAVDTETLWELDRFVTNYKKIMSNIKRQALINNAVQNDNHLAGMDEAAALGNVRNGEVGDVDIGDEMAVTHSVRVEIEKDDDGQAAHGSSSSSSGDSSSSDSDSGSSCGSDSNVDDAMLRDN